MATALNQPVNIASLLGKKDIEKLKTELRWGTYGKGGAEHCGGTCPDHQLQIKNLIDCNTEHLQAILRNQRHVHFGGASFYGVVIRSILQDRGVTPEEFSPEAEIALTMAWIEGTKKRQENTNMDFKVPDLNAGDGSTALALATTSAIDTVDTTEFVNETRKVIFVFGSNKEGAHGGGAANAARRFHGAIWGQSEGLQGDSYAIFTCGKPVGQPGYQIDITEVHGCIQRFLDEAVAELNGDDKFAYQITQVGCGLAGWKTEEIAPLFAGAPSNCYFDTAWKSYVDADAKFWGTK